MQAEERQKRIEEYLLKTEFASLEELSEVVDASVSTVRRDLSLLEVRGSLRRTHGGARLTNPKSEEFAFSARDTHQISEKELIGKACAGIIAPNQTVIIDAGTTTFHVAKYLEAKSPHVVTNSLPVANLFSGATRLEVLVSGGVIYPRLGVLVGPQAVDCFTRIRADLAIMSAGGISVEGISNSHGLLIEIQRAMIQSARKVIFCFDHTKFGRQSLSMLCGLNEVDVVVTEGPVPEDVAKALKENEVELVVARPE